MRVIKRKKQKPLIPNYQKEEKTILYVSVALTILLTLPDYHGQNFLTIALQSFAEWMMGWFPHLDVIAATREDSVKTRIVLASVIAMTPIQFGYFLWTMPAKLTQEDLSTSQLLKKLWRAAWAGSIAIVIFIAMLFVLTAPGWENSGNIARRFMPIIMSDIGSGLLMLFTSIGTIYILSALLVLISFVFRKLLNRRER